MKIEVESEALESLKAMAQRLQDDRDELLFAVKRAREWHHGDAWRNGTEKERDAWEQHKNMLESIIAKCSTCKSHPSKQMTEQQLAQLERSVNELIEANKRLSDVCQMQQSIIEALTRDRDGYKDMLQALQATMGDKE